MIKLFSLTFLLLLSSCATFKDFEKNKPVDMTPVFGGHQFSQDGQTLNGQSLIDGLEENPKAQHELEGLLPLQITSIALAGGAGYLVGGAFFAENTGQRLLIGGGLFGLGLLIGNWAGGKLERAVKIHNESFSKTATVFPVLFQDETLEEFKLGMGFSFNF